MSKKEKQLNRYENAPQYLSNYFEALQGRINSILEENQIGHSHPLIVKIDRLIPDSDLTLESLFFINLGHSTALQLNNSRGDIAYVLEENKITKTQLSPNSDGLESKSFDPKIDIKKLRSAARLLNATTLKQISISKFEVQENELVKVVESGFSDKNVNFWLLNPKTRKSLLPFDELFPRSKK